MTAIERPGPDDVDALLGALAARGHDFRDHRRETIERRLLDWIGRTGIADARRYAARVAADPAEAASLVEALLVTTSAFFRDPPLFAALERTVLPRLFGAGRPVRAWVVGAATGEEAWSLAMVMAEAAGDRGRFEIIASDVSAAALDHARAGRYAPGRADLVPAHHRARWLDDVGGEVVVRAGLRPHVRFCHHDLVGPALAPAEAVLASFDLVLCRNVLIYFGPRLQARAVERLVAALAPGGVLALGPYEALPPGADRALAPLPGAPRELNLFVAAEAR